MGGIRRDDIWPHRPAGTGSKNTGTESKKYVQYLFCLIFKHILISLPGEDDHRGAFRKREKKQQCRVRNRLREEDEGLGELMERKKKGKREWGAREDSADRMGLTVQTRLSSSTQISTCSISIRCYDDGNQRYGQWCSITWGHPLSWGIRSPSTAGPLWSGTFTSTLISPQSLKGFMTLRIVFQETDMHIHFF